MGAWTDLPGEFLAGVDPACPADADTATMAAWTVVANVLLNLDQALTRP